MFHTEYKGWSALGFPTYMYVPQAQISPPQSFLAALYTCTCAFYCFPTPKVSGPSVMYQILTELNYRKIDVSIIIIYGQWMGPRK